MIDWNLCFDCNFFNNLMPRKCKDFNWKIFYKQVNTETSLEKMNMSNGMCVVCENGKENLEHLLIDYGHVYGIWDAIARLIKSLFIKLRSDQSFHNFGRTFSTISGIKSGKHNTKHHQMDAVEI